MNFNNNDDGGDKIMSAISALRESDTRLIGTTIAERAEIIGRLQVLHLLHPQMVRLLRDDILVTVFENSMVAESIYHLSNETSNSEGAQLGRATCFKAYFERAQKSGHPFFSRSDRLLLMLYDAVLVATVLKRRTFLKEIAPLIVIVDDVHYFALCCAALMDDIELMQLWIPTEQMECPVKHTNTRLAVTAWYYLKASCLSEDDNNNKRFVQKTQLAAESSVNDMKAVTQPDSKMTTKQNHGVDEKKTRVNCTIAWLYTMTARLRNQNAENDDRRRQLVSRFEIPLRDACFRIRKGGQRLKQIRHMCVLQSVKDLVLAWLSLPIDDYPVHASEDHRLVMYDIYLLEVVDKYPYPEWVKRVLYINDILLRPGYIPLGVAMENITEVDAFLEDAHG